MLFRLQAIGDSSDVEISPDHTMIRTKYQPKQWPMLTTLKVDAPEFVPRTQRAGNILYHIVTALTEHCDHNSQLQLSALAILLLLCLAQFRINEYLN